MPNGEQQQQPQQPQRKWLAYNAFVYATNFLKELPIIKWYRLRKRTAITKEEKLKEPRIVKQELRDLFRLNDTLVGELKILEDRWNAVDSIVFGSPQLPEGLSPLIGKPESPGFYYNLGPYTDKSKVDLEISYFEYGSNVTTNLEEPVITRRVIEDMRNSLPANLQRDFNAQLRRFTQNDWDQIRESSNYLKIEIHGASITNEELRTTITQQELDAYSRKLYEEESRTRRVTLNEIREEEMARRQGTEKLYSFGYIRMEGLIKQLSGFDVRAFSHFLQRNPQINAAIRDARAVQYRELAKRLSQIKDIEKNHFDHLRGLVDDIKRVTSTITSLLIIAPERVRFKHTYMVIKPFITIDRSEEVDVVDATTGAIRREIRVSKVPIYFDYRRNTNLPNNLRPVHMKGNRRIDNIEDWQWSWERDANVPPGYDENGFPLEINPEGEVLLDKWWYEIGQNAWQRGVIADKPCGDRIIEKINTITRDGIRKVDSRWVNINYGNPYLDVLDMAVYISNEYDTYRDALRDGRHNFYSKTAVDYTIAAEEGFDIAPKYRVPKFWYREIPNIRKMYKSAIRYNELDPNDYVHRTPMDFERGLPREEVEVTRVYKMKLSNGQIISGERKPSHASPAFDLRAVNRVGSRVLWGRMLYYEWPDAINRWSENPFPTISTRGVAQFLLDRVLRDLYEYDDQRRTMIEFTQQGYDYGVRRPLIGGSKSRFPKDLVGGSDVVQPGEWS